MTRRRMHRVGGASDEGIRAPAPAPGRRGRSDGRRGRGKAEQAEESAYGRTVAVDGERTGADPAQRGMAIAVWISCFMGGTILGPLVGGLMLQTFWWGSVFLLGVPVMALLLIAGPLLLPEHRNVGASWPDLVSVALSLAAILPVIYGIKTLAADGWSAVPLTAIVAGVVMGVLFLRRQRTAATPLLDVTLFGNRSFRASMIVFVLGAIVMAGAFYLISQYGQLVLGLSPLRAGVLLIPGSLAMLGASLVAPSLGNRYGAARVVGIGLAISAAGFVILSRLGTDSPWLLVAGGAVLCAGMGPMPALLTNLVVGSVSPDKAGSASAVSETGNELGMSVGVAVIGSIGGAVYRSVLDGRLPNGLPAGARAAAREGLPNALAVAHGVGAPAGAALTSAARVAFTSGLHTAALIGALMFIGLAAAALRLLADPARTAETIAHSGPEGLADEVREHVSPGSGPGSGSGTVAVPEPAPAHHHAEPAREMVTT